MKPKRPPLRRRKLEVTGPDEFGSMYVNLKKISPGGVARTVPHSITDHNEVYLDYDKDGNLIGIELLNVREKLGCAS